MKILLAEDETISRRVLERQLSHWGHRVTATCDGAERASWTKGFAEPIEAYRVIGPDGGRPRSGSGTSRGGAG